MQHYHTFAERLKDMPVKVDFISRARKPKDVKRAAFGVDKAVYNAPVSLRCVYFSGFMEHSVEQMHTFVTHCGYLKH